MEFPVFRKYPNKKHFFRVVSEEKFEEIRIMGGRYTIEKRSAQTLPDRNLIMDMIRMENGPWEDSSEEEFNEVLSDCKKYKTPL